MDFRVKQEVIDSLAQQLDRDRSHDVLPRIPVSVIDLSSSDSDSDDSDAMGVAAAATAYVLEREAKRARVSDGFGSYSKAILDELGVVFPLASSNPPPLEAQEPYPSSPVLPLLPAPESVAGHREPAGRKSVLQSSKQFWKAGDYEGCPNGDWNITSGGMDHVRVHPKFLHSNATSHKWALGAFAELLDNSLDEVCNGATFVSINVHENKKDGSRMLIIEDNGGGMDPERMRQCMSLGYSAKSKIANTIGQYGNGFKTSTMRLGADVIVFSRCRGEDGKSPSQTIGLLSYTFLRSTGKEDIVVPMLDYEMQGREWTQLLRYSGDWNKNLDTIVEWSPFSSEADLLRQFNLMKDHGTRIIIYNLWEDDQGLLELDFDSDPYDIQLRGVNRDEKNIQMAKQFPNSKHFLTYRHSLRSYASILYLRLPPSFRIILRGRDVEHHNIVNDMMMSQEKSYRPQSVAEGAEKELDMTATVTIGFVKDAKFHIDVQGFNVYHKNRLIKPFWRLWNAAGSDGRGVIGVLEANFVEPAHDKQGFERTTVLARLEAKLIQMQKAYWCTLCHKIGYAPRRNKNEAYGATDRENSSNSKRKFTASSSKLGKDSQVQYELRTAKSGKRPITSDTSSPSVEDASDDDIARPPKRANGSIRQTLPARNSFQKEGLRINRPSSHLEDNESRQDCASAGRRNQPEPKSQFKGNIRGANDCFFSDADLRTLEQLREENRELRERLEKQEGEMLSQLQQDLQNEKDRRKSLESQVEEAQRIIEGLNKEQESLIDIFSEERERRDMEEENLRKKLKDASNTIQQLLKKVESLERTKS